MPELPDVVVYVEALAARVVGHRLLKATLRGPFLLRTVTPPMDALLGQTAVAVRRAGKRIVIGFEIDALEVYSCIVRKGEIAQISEFRLSVLVGGIIRPAVPHLDHRIFEQVFVFQLAD